VLTSWTERPLADLLAAYGLADSLEMPFPNDGWSGSELTRYERPDDGASFILKRTSWAVDWIARSTRDHHLREGFIAGMPLPLPPPLVAPYLGAAADGTTLAMLMPDLSGKLLGWDVDEPVLTGPQMDRIFDMLARLHTMPWPIADQDDADLVWPSTPLAERIFLLAPRNAARNAGDGVWTGKRFQTGWAAFERTASKDARKLVERLDADPAPLLAALEALPRTGLHGDMKLNNVGLLEDGRIALLDWQMTMLAPVTVELGWMLVCDSGVLPDRPDVVLDRYRAAVEAVAGQPFVLGEPYDPARPFPVAGIAATVGDQATAQARTIEHALGDWTLQRDMVWIIGLLLRGWRKGLDTEAGLVLPSGVSAADDLVWWSDHAVEAAERHLGR
jgi:hypothetical protein